MCFPQLTCFYYVIAQDDRVRPTHISVYMALFECWHVNGFQNPIWINRAQVMKMAKIAGLATYHKCISQLQEYGYIEYIPSFHPGCYSQVNFNYCNLKLQEQQSSI